MSSNGKGIDLSQPLDRRYAAKLLARIESGSQKMTRCWLWTGYCIQGYGVISVHNKSTGIHQLSYAIHRGPIPKGKYVLHKCDVRNCWRPRHLFLGTHLENIADMLKKGRGSTPPVIRGENHPKATLTDAQVAIIRMDTLTPQRKLASIYGVSQSTIWRFRQGITRTRC